jgi:hypothetical protein
MSTNRPPICARTVLGPDHPLTRVTMQLTRAVERSVTVSLMLAIGVLALIGDLSIGGPLTVAAATVLAALVARAGALAGSRRRRALELIAEGRGELPLQAVVRERRRLLDPVHRERLARTLDVIRTEVERPACECHRIRPLYNVPVVRPVSSELVQTAGLVRHDGGLRGLARAEQLVTDGRSALYGDDEVLLREELGRIHVLLESRDEWGSLPIPRRPLRS